MTINIGLIGCGRIAQQKHLKILQSLPGVNLAALAEADPQRAAEAQARARSARLFSDYHDLLLDAQVDAVVICLPTSLHAESAVAALGSEKHVYLEKPIATNLNEGDAVLAAWRHISQRGAYKVGMIGFAFRADTAYRELRAHIQQGTVGPIVAVRTSFSTQRRDLPGWKTQRSSGGGVLLDLASHHIDALRFLLDDDVVNVAATLESRYSEDDNASLSLQMQSGLSVQLFCSMTSLEEHRVEIYGERGKLVLDRFHAPGVEVLPSGLEGARTRRIQQALQPQRLLFQPEYDQPFVAALGTFARAVASELPASPDFADGYHSLAVVDAVERAARSGLRADVRQPASLVSVTA